MKYIIFTTGENKHAEIDSLKEAGEVTVALINDSEASDVLKTAQALYEGVSVQDAIKVVRALKKIEKKDDYVITSDGSAQSDQYLDAVKGFGFDVVAGTAPEAEEPEGDDPPPPPEGEVAVDDSALVAELEEAKNLITELQDKISKHDGEMGKLKETHAEEIREIKDSIAAVLSEPE